MRILILSIIFFVLLSGCTGYVETGKLVENNNEPEKVAQVFPKPQVTSTQGTVEETKVTAETTVNVTTVPAETTSNATNAPEETTEPKIYNVNVVLGLGIQEGAG